MITVTHAAALLQVSITTIRNAIYRGELAAQTLENGRILINELDIAHLLPAENEHRVDVNVAAFVLNKSVPRIYQMMDEGTISHVKIFGAKKVVLNDIVL